MLKKFDKITIVAIVTCLVPAILWSAFGLLWIAPTISLFERGYGTLSSLAFVIIPLTMGALTIALPIKLRRVGRNISPFVSSAISLIAFLAYFLVVMTLSAT